MRTSGSDRRSRSRLAGDMVILAVVGVLLVTAVGAGAVSLYRSYYGPSAFVEDYISLLNTGRAADALRVPGVAVDSASLEAAGIPASVSDALLRNAALLPLADVKVESESPTATGHKVTVSYSAGSVNAKTTFEVAQDGWIGVAPRWRFQQSPLAAVSLIVRGADKFAVNGFEMHRQQVSPEGPDADPLAPILLLVFSPGIYAFSVDTAISKAPGISVVADSVMSTTQVDMQTQPTEAFTEVVQQRVDEFLSTCASQEVLHPTGCPFGYEVHDRLAALPAWSIVTKPTLEIQPEGSNWRFPPTPAAARIEVTTVSLFDGHTTELVVDVPFLVNGTITILPDESARIEVGAGTD